MIVVIGAVSLISLYLVYLLLRSNSLNGKTIPEPEDKWPLLGHSPMMMSQKDHDELHYRLGNQFKDETGLYRIRHNLR